MPEIDWWFNFLKLRVCGTYIHFGVPFAGISMTVFSWKFLTTLIISKIKMNLFSVEAQIFWEGHKNWKNLPFSYFLGDFFKILLPSQNIWTLMIFLFIKNCPVIAQKKHLIKSVCKKSPNPIHITAFLCVKSDIEPRAMSWATKKEETDPCFFTTTFTDVNFAKWQMICLNSSFIV